MKLYAIEKRTEESSRFRDYEDGTWQERPKSSGKFVRQIVAQGKLRAYYEQRALISGFDFWIRRPADGPDAVSLVQFEGIASRVFDNVMRVSHGIDVPVDIFNR